MASLLPLLHDLLPIFLPAEVRVARGGELVAVEERADRPPWYQQRQTPPRAANTSKTARSTGGIEETTQHAHTCEPIQLLDYEGDAPGNSSDEQGPTAGPSTGEPGPIPAHVRGGPKVFRKDAMVGVSDRMCVTGKPRMFAQRLFRKSFSVIDIHMDLL